MRLTWIRTLLLGCVAALIASAAVSCGGTPIDLQKNLKVNSVTTGWYNDGVVDGKNKLVPSLSFTITNQSNASLGSLQVNAVYKRVGETEEWGTAFSSVAGADGLAAGVTTPTLALHSPLGYTGTEPPEQMLQNHLFVDAQVTLFAKYGSGQWTKLAEFPVKRVLLAK
ncbi:MAG TPA: hypothetical protein VND92_03110 [Vicinamibacterales bacterium]|nr:hypothetical protein [Vicinamibacterales bacterium]